MLHHLAVFSSDEGNANGVQMPLATLVNSVEQGWHLGQPLYLSHDQHRLEGWTRALGIFLEPGLARLIGICFAPENAEDSEFLKRRLIDFLQLQLQETVVEFLPDLKSRIGDRLNGDEQPMNMSCAAIVGQGLAQRVFPNAFSDVDKDGLVSIEGLRVVAPGVFERDGLLLFASHQMRRSLSRHNTLNEPFLHRLHALTDRDDVTVRLRLDTDAVGLASTYARPVEFAHWWGPSFNDDLLSIPSGIAHHEASDRQRLFSGVHSTEFWWHNQNDLKTLECEELIDIPSLGEGAAVYGCRYAHSIVDSSDEQPFHFDGAIRIYDEDKMFERLGANIREAGRHSDYRKQWRVDGVIPIPIWKELLAHYFRDNELVGEYLGGREKTEHMRPRLLSESDDPLITYVPCNMVPGEGVRVSVSNHLPLGTHPVADGIYVRPMDTFGTDENQSPVVEADSIEVAKLLRRRDLQVSSPDDVLRLGYEDTSANLAMFMHIGNSASQLAEQTMDVFGELCDKWVARDDDRTITFNLWIEYADRCVHFSFAGHVDDLKAFMQRKGNGIPKDPSGISDWLEAAYRCMNDATKSELDRPPIGKVLRKTGILRFDRNIINRNHYQLTMEDGPGVVIAVPESNSELAELVANGDLGFSRVHVIQESLCSRCADDYLKCKCSKYMDDDVRQIIVKAPILDLFWTNRPASGTLHIKHD